jgi:LEA14-like dessication related protein
MERKLQIGVLLLVFLIILNVVIGSVFVFFIQDIKEPDVNVEFNLMKITTDEMSFTAGIFIGNDNQYDLVIKNLILKGVTPEGHEFLDIQFAGGTIPAKQKRIFTTNDTVSFAGSFSSKIYGSIDGIFGANILGVFEKTIPLHINITASFQDLLKNIAAPTLDITAEVTNVTEQGVFFHAVISVDNPNLFEMTLEDFTVRFQTENGTSVGSFSPIHGSITPNATSYFHLNGTLLFEALNAKVLTLQLTGNAGVHLMGINASIPLSANAQLIVPNIRQLLFNNETLGITISLDIKLRLRGFLTTIGLTLYNPSSIPLQAQDLICSIYALTGENEKLIAQKFMESSTVESEQQDFLETQLLIPYLKVFTAGIRKIFPDWFVIRIQGNFSIAGVDQSIPVSIDATISPHLFFP